MGAREEALEKLKLKEAIEEDFVAKLKAAEEVAPLVQESLALTQWQRMAIETSPDEADEVPFPGLNPTYDSDLAHLGTALPAIPEFDLRQVEAISGMSASGTTTVYDYANRVGDLGTPAALEYRARVTLVLTEVQERFDTQGTVRSQIETRLPRKTLRRFDKAQKSCLAYHRGGTDREGPANDMRNLLDGVKGDLMHRAGSRRGRRVAWAPMARLIAKDAPDGPLADELVRQEAVQDALIVRLGDVLHDQEAGSTTDPNSLWMDVLGYLRTVLGLVDWD